LGVIEVFDLGPAALSAACGRSPLGGRMRGGGLVRDEARGLDEAAALIHPASMRGRLRRLAS